MPSLCPRLVRVKGAVMLLILFCLGLAENPLYSQTASLRGQVIDSVSMNNPHNAVVMLISGKDSTLYAFTRTNKSGRFQFETVPVGKYTVLITCPGFADYRDTLLVKDTFGVQMGIIPLYRMSQLLNYILITAKKEAIRVKGDTTEFVADSFRTKQGATVEDLLKKLPGLQVDRNGKILAQGKEVQKILVDGEEFFGDDPTVATKNLEAKSVDVVQVYDTKTEEAKTTGVVDGSTVKVLDIKLKEANKKGYFGNLTTGRDLRDIYEHRAMFNTFTSQRKFSVYGLALNSPNVGLSWGEREEFGGGLESQYDPESGYTWTSYQSDDLDYWLNYTAGLPVSREAGTTYIDKLMKGKWKLNGSYSYKELDLNASETNNSTTLLNGRSIFNSAKSTVLNSKRRHTVNLRNEWQIDSNTTLRLKVTGRSNEVNTQSDYFSYALTDGLKINEQNRRLKINGQSSAVSWNGNLRHIIRSKKGRYYNLGFTGEVGKSDNDDSMNSDNLLFSDSGRVSELQEIRQLRKSDVNNARQSFSFLYNEPLSGKLELAWVASGMYAQNRTDKVTSNLNTPGEFVDSLSSFARYHINHVQTGFILKYKRKKWGFSLSNNFSRVLLSQRETLRNLDYKKPFFNVLPGVSFNYIRSKQSTFNLGYNTSVRQPDATQIQPLIDNTNPLFLQQGNPGLKQAFEHSFSLGMNDGKVLKQRWFYARLNYQIFRNAFAVRSFIDSFGRNVSQYTNTDGNQNLWGYMNYSKQIAKTPLSFNGSINSGLNKSVNFLNEAPSVTRSSNAGISGGIEFEIDALYFELSFTHNQNHSTNSLNKTVNNNWTRSIEGNVEINLPADFTISFEMTANFRQKTELYTGNRNNTIITGELNKPVFKKTLLLTIGVYDLLNQNFGYSRNVSGYSISEREFNAFRQFFYGKLRYSFKSKPKKMPKE